MNKTWRVINVTLLTLFLCLSVAAAGRIETVKFQSKLVNATLPYNVILPADYDASRNTRYPVLYLLHGLDGHYSDWISHTNIADYASEYSLIIVMPEGNDGWYTDSATVATDKYESYILKELLPDVEARYRTIQARYGRAIAGLSMGGYGAIKFGLKSPQTFAFAASMSGVFNVMRLTEKEIPASWKHSLDLVGPVDSDMRQANDLFELIEKLPAGRVQSLPYFYFDCGTEDLPLIFASNRQMALVMYEKKIPHEFRELPGDHSWAYWDRQVQEVLRIAGQKLPRVKLTKARGV
jgi:S-formylglutathione hydrolase FrmB